MKKRYPIFLGILLFLPSIFQAKTLVVREYGRGTLYSNLQQAHNAATDGDTIAVDAAADGSWEEGTTVTISKQVYLTTLQNRKLKLINGLEIKLLNNRKLTVTDLDSTAISISGTGELTIANCVVKTDLSVPYTVKFNCFKSIVLGKIIAFYLKAMGNNLKDGVTVLSSNISNDTILLVGNIFGGSFVIDAEKVLILSNNFFKINAMSADLYGCNLGAGIFIIKLNNDPANFSKSIISNNTIWFSGNSAAGSILRVLNDLEKNSGSLLIFSNSFLSNLNGTINWQASDGCNSGNTYSFLNYNARGKSLVNNYVALRNHNQYGGSWAVKPTGSKDFYGTSIPAIDSLGRLSGPDFTNKGLDLPEFSDIDLTRNDIGTEGGPWPISNFWGPNASKAWVGWLDLPLKISTPSTPIQIKATGINKD
jgi:hypothetical protein